MDEPQFFQHWELLKPLLLAKWSRLKAADLENVEPEEHELTALIQKKYPDMPKESIREDLNNVAQQILKWGE